MFLDFMEFYMPYAEVRAQHCSFGQSLIALERTAKLNGGYSQRDQILAIYGPRIYAAPYVMFLVSADPLGQVGGSWVLEIETFLMA